MGAVAIGIYKLMMTVSGSNVISTLISIVAAAIVYVVLIFVLKIMSEEEIKMFPGGNVIYKVLVKTGLYK